MIEHSYVDRRIVCESQKGGARPNAGSQDSDAFNSLLALTGALLAWALFFGGGDSSARLAWIGGAAVLVAAVAVAAVFDGRLERPRVGRVGAACAGCIAALVIWQGISIVWSVQPDRSWDYVNRGLVRESEKGSARTNAGSQDSDAFDSLFAQPTHCGSGIEYRLAHRLNGAADV